jgi:hypothetical protein
MISRNEHPRRGNVRGQLKHRNAVSNGFRRVTIEATELIWGGEGLCFCITEERTGYIELADDRVLPFGDTRGVDQTRVQMVFGCFAG